MGSGKGRAPIRRGSYGGPGSSYGTVTSYSSKKKEKQKTLVEYIESEGVDNLRKLVSLYNPALGKVVQVIEFVYKNRKELAGAYTEIKDTWDSDSTLEEKVLDTASTAINTTATIAKKEGLTDARTIASKAISTAAVATLDDAGIFETIDSSLNIPNAGDRFKDLLQDTIEKETNQVLTKAMREENEKK